MALTKFNYNSFDLTTAASKGLSFNSSANGFETATEGSMTLIKTLTASSSSTLSFVNGSSDVVLDNTYPVYVFKFINIHPSASRPEFSFNLSTNSGSSYGVTKTSTAFYSQHNEGGGSSLAYDSSSDLAQSTSAQHIAWNLSNDNEASISGNMYLFNPSSTTFVKHFLTELQFQYDSSGGDPASYTYRIGGYANTTSAINGIKYLYNSGNIDSGTIKLYGIKDS